jgi:hypothetical protein
MVPSNAALIIHILIEEADLLFRRALEVRVLCQVIV